MANENLDPVVEKIVDLVNERVSDTFEGTNTKVSFDTALLMSRELGYIKANKGRVGGFSPTDDGLDFAGVDKTAYAADVESKKELSSIEARIASLLKKKEELLNGTADMPVVTDTQVVEAVEAVQA